MYKYYIWDNKNCAKASLGKLASAALRKLYFHFSSKYRGWLICQDLQSILRKLYFHFLSH